jgi:hypothetical protein
VLINYLEQRYIFFERMVQFFCFNKLLNAV